MLSSSFYSTKHKNYSDRVLRRSKNYKLKFILAFDAVIYIPCRMYNTCLQSLNTIAKRHEHNASYTFSFIHLWKKYNTPELNVDGVAINLRLLKYNVRW